MQRHNRTPTLCQLVIVRDYLTARCTDLSKRMAADNRPCDQQALDDHHHALSLELHHIQGLLEDLQPGQEQLVLFGAEPAP